MEVMFIGTWFTWLRLWLFVTLFVAAVCDWRTRRIPNFWTFGAFFGGLAVTVLTAWGSGGVLREAAGYLLRSGAACIVFFPLYMLRRMGAGDVKWIAVIAGCLGVTGGLYTIFYGCILGAVLVFLKLLAQDRMRWYLVCQSVRIRRMFQMKKFIKDRGFGGPGFGIPLAACLFIGYLLWLGMQL